MSSEMSNLLRYSEVQEIVDYVIDNRNMAIGMLNFQIKHPEGLINRSMKNSAISKMRKVDCEVCFESKYSDRVPIVGACLHRVCFSCLLSYVDAESKKLEGTTLICPHQDEFCTVLYTGLKDDILNEFNPEIRHYPGLKERLEKALVRGALTEVDNVVKCPTPDCENAIFSDDPLEEDFYVLEKDPKRKRKSVRDVTKLRGRGLRRVLEKLKIKKRFKVNRSGRDMRAARCRDCGVTFCIFCKEEWMQHGFSHEQLFCNEFKDSFDEEFRNRTEIEMKKMRKDGLLKDCPKCKSPIEKNLGCKHMTCFNCKHEYCWHCKGNWRVCSCAMYE